MVSHFWSVDFYLHRKTEWEGHGRSGNQNFTLQFFNSYYRQLYTFNCTDFFALIWSKSYELQANKLKKVTTLVYICGLFEKQDCPWTMSEILMQKWNSVTLNLTLLSCWRSQAYCVFHHFEQSWNMSKLFCSKINVEN